MQNITERWFYNGSTLYVAHHQFGELGVFKIRPMCVDGVYFFNKPFSMPMAPDILAKSKDDVIVVTFTKHDNPILEITKQPYF